VLRCVIRWQSALPVRQALARDKLGIEPPNYVIALSGLLPNIAHGDLREAALRAKGRAALRPSDIQFATRPDSVEIYFLFPKNVPFTLDDKDIEFSTRVGPWDVKYRFHLKDLLYRGRLEL
jgi:hypothetical protein